MDDYPDELAPDFEESGGVAAPFESWWPNVRHYFSNVPEEVAREWLHRHWGHSPWGFLTSSLYTFKLVEWAATDLSSVLSWMDDWDPQAALTWDQGIAAQDFYVARYMRENGCWPSPIIVLDNRKGCLDDDDRKPTTSFPHGHLLVEGHSRHGIALAMQASGSLNGRLPVWRMQGR